MNDQPQHSVLEAEDHESGYDSSSVTSDLTSLRSSILSYEYENGRRYHAFHAGKYLLPNDDDEQNRLDILHHVFRLTLGGSLCWTKLQEPAKILDIGTGTGIWAIQAGDEYPGAEVIGIDLSPIQPSWVPPNVSFHVDDATQEWAWPQNSFDFIHMRCLAGSITDWPELLRQAYLHLKPGGQIELSEIRPNIYCDDESYPDDCSTKKYVVEFHRIAHEAGLEFDMFPKFDSLLRSSGFEGIKAYTTPTPIGTWPKDKRLKEIGAYFHHQFIEFAIESFALALFTRFGNWTESETQVLLALVRQELKSNKMHIYTHWYVNNRRYGGIGKWFLKIFY